MKNIIIYGAPAAGKGTVCESLIDKYNYKHISTGELFRNLDDSEESRKIKETISKGILIDDETTANLLKKHLKNKTKEQIILDGFPRTVNQAKMLDEFFDNFIVINLTVEEDIAMKRTLGRLTCSGCGKIYNKYNKDITPKVEGICDICGNNLTSRSDDNEESFKVRYNTYINNCESVFNYYKNRNILYMVDSNKDPDTTFNSVEEIITKVN